MEFKNDNDYSLTVFGTSGYMCKMQYVHSLHTACEWLGNSKYKDWQTINVYARRSRRFIVQYKRNKDSIHDKPR